MPSGTPVLEFDEIDSTSLESKRRFEACDVGPVWFFAHEQTNGYGRRGTEWKQTKGNLAATLLFPFGEEQKDVSKLSFLAGLALYDACGLFRPDAELALKWPNDLMLDGAKLSGLLLEMLKSDDGARSAISLGVGVNIAVAPTVAEYPTARLTRQAYGEAISTITAAELLQHFDKAFWEWLSRFQALGFAPIAQRWCELAYGLGRAATLTTGAEIVHGTMNGLGKHGEILLETPDGVRAFSAGTLRVGT